MHKGMKTELHLYKTFTNSAPLHKYVHWLHYRCYMDEYKSDVYKQGAMFFILSIPAPPPSEKVNNRPIFVNIRIHKDVTNL